MPTLEEVYERRLDEDEGDGGFRVRAGMALLSVGVFMMFFGGVVAFSETVGALFDATVPWERWGVGAIFAGAGLPVAFTGVFVVVPAPRRDQAVAGFGILVAFLGVLLFDIAYPSMWQGNDPDLSPLVFTVYALGSFLMFGALFRSVLDIEISLPRSSLSFEYEGDDLPSREERIREEMSTETRSSTSTDGGVGFAVADTTDAEVVRKEKEEDEEEEVSKSSAGFAGDKYCGNCAFYEYVTQNGGGSPFCEFHGEELDDLEACDEHEMRLGSTRRGRSE